LLALPPVVAPSFHISADYLSKSRPNGWNAIRDADGIDSSQALWPGARFTERDRERAVERGLRFIYRTALDPRNFAEHGHNYLWCYDTTARVLTAVGEI
jgi:hypothetical protein